MIVTEYQSARKCIKTGDIILFKGQVNNWLDKLIMFFTNSVYVHAGIAVWVSTENDTDRLMLLDSQGNAGGTRMINLSYYSELEMSVFRKYPLSQTPDIITKAMNNIGTIKYGWTDCIYDGIREKLGRFGIHIKPRNFSGDNCSEFVSRCYSLPFMASPGLLYACLATNKDFTNTQEIVKM